MVHMINVGHSVVAPLTPLSVIVAVHLIPNPELIQTKYHQYYWLIVVIQVMYKIDWIEGGGGYKRS